jgi:DNA repair ATPase RecN
MTEESELLKELREIKSEIKKLSEDVGKITYIINEKWEREEAERHFRPRASKRYYERLKQLREIKRRLKGYEED